MIDPFEKALSDFIDTLPEDPADAQGLLDRSAPFQGKGDLPELAEFATLLRAVPAPAPSPEWLAASKARLMAAPILPPEKRSGFTWLGTMFLPLAQLSFPSLRALAAPSSPLARAAVAMVVLVAMLSAAYSQSGVSPLLQVTGQQRAADSQVDAERAISLAQLEVTQLTEQRENNVAGAYIKGTPRDVVLLAQYFSAADAAIQNAPADQQARLRSQLQGVTRSIRFDGVVDSVSGSSASVSGVPVVLDQQTADRVKAGRAVSMVVSVGADGQLHAVDVNPSPAAQSRHASTSSANPSPASVSRASAAAPSSAAPSGAPASPAPLPSSPATGTSGAVTPVTTSPSTSGVIVSSGDQAPSSGSGGDAGRKSDRSKPGANNTGDGDSSGTGVAATYVNVPLPSAVPTVASARGSDADGGNASSQSGSAVTNSRALLLTVFASPPPVPAPPPASGSPADGAPAGGITLPPLPPAAQLASLAASDDGGSSKGQGQIANVQALLAQDQPKHDQSSPPAPPLPPAAAARLQDSGHNVAAPPMAAVPPPSSSQAHPAPPAAPSHPAPPSHAGPRNDGGGKGKK